MGSLHSLAKHPRTCRGAQPLLHSEHCCSLTRIRGATASGGSSGMRPLNEFSVGLPSPRPQITRWSRVGLTQSGGEDLLISAFALRHLLRMLYGESHAVALRRDRAPLEGRSRVRGISGSATAATPVFIAPSPIWIRGAITVSCWNLASQGPC